MSCIPGRRAGTERQTALDADSWSTAESSAFLSGERSRWQSLGAWRGSGIPQRWWFASAAGRIVLLYDVGGDAPAPANRQAVRPNQASNVTLALPVSSMVPGGRR